MTRRLKSRLAVANTLLLGSILGIASAQDAAPSDPAQLVRQTVQNEIAATNAPVSERFMFKSRKQSDKGSQTKLYVETQEGMVGLVIALNDQPLTPEQHQAEEARVGRFLSDPAELQKKRKHEKDDAERTVQIMKALPDAFVYEPDGAETGTSDLGKNGDPLVRLKFRPNPNYEPPTHTEQVLTGMQGTLIVDARQHRIAKIDGTLFKEVGFGWGILGHLDKGGRFVVQQANVGQNEWNVTHMTLNFTGKIMMFKSLKIQSDEVYSDFHAVAKDLSFAQGLDLLRKKEGAELAQNGSPASGMK